MRRLSLKALFAIVFLVPCMAMAQNQSPPPPAADQQLLKAEELDALVAPIALYPDTLLAQVLMASTYPLEVVQADRWATENKKLKGDQLKTAAEKQAWDDSVKALVATPSVLDDDEHQARLDAEAGRCGSCPAARYYGCGTEVARESSGEQKVIVD